VVWSKVKKLLPANNKRPALASYGDLLKAEKKGKKADVEHEGWKLTLAKAQRQVKIPI